MPALGRFIIIQMPLKTIYGVINSGNGFQSHQIQVQNEKTHGNQE